MPMPLTLNSLLLDCGGGRGQGDDALRAAIEGRLKAHRAVVLRNTGMQQVAEMAAWADFIGAPRMEYKYGTGFRAPMGAGVLSVGTEPPFTPVDPHNEMAYWHYYPRKILFGCEAVPARGADTVIADNVRVTEAILPTRTGRKILDIGIRYVRNFGDRNRPDSIATMKYWQDAFGFESLDELENYCAER